MSILEIKHISKRFGNLYANENVSLTLETGEILALLGENGAGKTTLMNILFGHYAADSGTITAFGKTLPAESTDAALNAGIGMVHQHFTLADNVTVLENIMLGTESMWSLWSNKKRATKKIQKLTDSLNLKLDVNALISDLAIGERQRVEILKALYRDVKILILDEPTAVLTPQEVDSLFDMLRQMAANGMAIIIISHKLHEVLAISHRVTVLRHGKMVGEAATDSIDRDKLAEMIVGHEVKRPTIEALSPGNTVISLENISLNDSRQQRPLLNAINLHIREHEIIGLAGVSGNGQKELSDLLSGLRKPDSGSLQFRGKNIKKYSPKTMIALGAARIPEDRHAAGVIGEMTVWENLLLEDLGRKPCWKSGLFLSQKEARQRATDLIEQFDIRCANMDIPANLLSGGNMQKLILARNFQLNPDFVLANQPVRGLDEGAIAFVHGQILRARKNGAGVLLISEDLDELLRLSDRIVVMHNGELSKAMDAATLTQRDLGVLMTGGHLESTQQGHANAL